MDCRAECRRRLVRAEEVCPPPGRAASDTRWYLQTGRPPGAVRVTFTVVRERPRWLPSRTRRPPLLNFNDTSNWKPAGCPVPRIPTQFLSQPEDRAEYGQGPGRPGTVRTVTVTRTRDTRHDRDTRHGHLRPQRDSGPGDDPSWHSISKFQIQNVKLKRIA